MSDYQTTVAYWQQVFITGDYSPVEELANSDLEQALTWVVGNEGRIIDFGCGNGRVLYRCLAKGAASVHGIDITPNAIQLANGIKAKYQLAAATFRQGGVESLQELSAASFSGAVLFNILDNLTPRDGIQLLTQTHRLLQPAGRLILKLNPYLTMEQRNRFGLVELEPDFYREKSGLYLWNMTNQQVQSLLDPYFRICQYQEVFFPEHDVTNRLYYLGKI